MKKLFILAMLLLMTMAAFAQDSRIVNYKYARTTSTGEESEWTYLPSKVVITDTTINLFIKDLGWQFEQVSEVTHVISEEGIGYKLVEVQNVVSKECAVFQIFDDASIGCMFIFSEVRYVQYAN